MYLLPWHPEQTLPSFPQAHSETTPPLPGNHGAKFTVPSELLSSDVLLATGEFLHVRCSFVVSFLPRFGSHHIPSPNACLGVH